MNLSDEDKATLIAAAKVLMREPDETFIERDYEDGPNVSNSDAGAALYDLLGLLDYKEPIWIQLKPRVLAGTQYQYSRHDYYDTLGRIYNPEWSCKISG